MSKCVAPDGGREDGCPRGGENLLVIVMDDGSERPAGWHCQYHRWGMRISLPDGADRAEWRSPTGEVTGELRRRRAS